MESGIIANEGDRKMTADIRVYCDPRLKDLAGKAADKAGLPLSEFIVQLIAKGLRKPELAKIPRKSIGRPRNKAGV